MKRVLLPFLCLVLAACAAPERAAGPLLGSDRDARGCIASAGYTYVRVLNRCMRLWEEGIQLRPSGAAAPGEAVFGAFAVLSADGAEAELFLPRREKSALLKRAFTTEGPYWAGGTLRLERLPDGWRLLENGRETYNAPNPPPGAN